MTTKDHSFETLELPAVIDTSTTDFVEEFYNPLLSRAGKYQRGVGYFTSNWLESAARGVASLAERGGTAEWLVSPQLTPEDWKALQKANQAERDEIIASKLEEEVQDLEVALTDDTRNAIAWMIYDDILEIRFAVPERSLGGDFHDKWGIITDEVGNQVAFHGSKNDSHQSFRNYESYDVFCDWVDEREQKRVEQHQKRFETLWDSENETVSVHTLPEAIKTELVELRDEPRPYDDDSISSDEKTSTITENEDNSEITLWEFQQQAVEAWFENGRRGIFKMATGTGKTYTAIGAAQQLVEDVDDTIAIVVAVPYTHLARQWEESFSDWGFDTVHYTFGSLNPQWKSTLKTAVGEINIGIRETEIFLTTHRTLSHEFFQKQVSRLNCESLLIGDEVHGLGSPTHREGLIEPFDFRLGLSATPKRFYDESGTDRLMEYFDGITFEYSLDDAIPEYLTEYNYFPRLVELTREEMEEYREFSTALATELSKDNPDEERIETLTNKRANILKSADNKFRQLRTLLNSLTDLDHLLIYTNHEQITDVQNILNSKGVVQHKFTFEEDEAQRETLLEGFDTGKYDALVAMRCLDEGVNVPSTRQAILMSNSRNPKQFIQRRGRVLRKVEGKAIAQIYDMIVVPSLNPDDDIIDSEKKILEKELQRFEEFASTAKNEAEARNTIQRIKRLYEL